MNSEWINKNLKPTIFYIVMFLFILAFSTTAKDYDFDFWARLIAGMSVVQTGHVLKHDFLSYTPTHTWFDHEWGSGVIFYLTQHFFSSMGIIFLQALLVFLIFFTMSKIIALRGVKTTSAYNFLFYYFSFISMSYILNEPVRCQLFSFLFFTVFLYILERTRLGIGKDLELIIYTPLIMIVWNNLHGGSVSGIGLIIIYIIGELLNHKSIKKYLWALVLSILVLPINPWGVGYLDFLFKANTMHRPYVVEWWGLFSNFFMFKCMKFKIFALVLLLTEIGVITKQFISKTFAPDKTKFLILAVTLFLAIQHVKLIPFAVISMSCLIYDDFYTVFNNLTKNIFEKIANAKEVVIYGLILVFAITNINKKAFLPLISVGRYPILPIEFIKTNEIKGNLLINFGLGSYTSYKLYPNNKIFMDGRYEEVYYDYMIPMLRNFYMLKPGWDEILVKFTPDVMVIEKFYPVFKFLKKDKKWTLVFEDNAYGVFVKAQNAKKTYKKLNENPDLYRKTLFDTDINFMLKSRYE